MGSEWFNDLKSEIISWPILNATVQIQFVEEVYAYSSKTPDANIDIFLLDKIASIEILLDRAPVAQISGSETNHHHRLVAVSAPTYDLLLRGLFVHFKLCKDNNKLFSSGLVAKRNTLPFSKIFLDLDVDKKFEHLPLQELVHARTQLIAKVDSILQKLFNITWSRYNRPIITHRPSKGSFHYITPLSMDFISNYILEKYLLTILNDSAATERIFTMDRPSMLSLPTVRGHIPEWVNSFEDFKKLSPINIWTLKENVIGFKPIANHFSDSITVLIKDLKAANVVVESFYFKGLDETEADSAEPAIMFGSFLLSNLPGMENGKYSIVYKLGKLPINIPFNSVNEFLQIRNTL